MIARDKLGSSGKKASRVLEQIRTLPSSFSPASENHHYHPYLGASLSSWLCGAGNVKEGINPEMV